MAKSQESKTATSSDAGLQNKRGKWGNKFQFVLSCIGFSVGLGNVWRFSSLAYQNGGGAFLLPYLIAVVVCGLPLYVLELALGQFASLGPVTVFRRMAPLFQGLGWGVLFVSINIALYYNVIIAWILYYLFESFRAELRWKDCHNTHNTYNCWSTKEEENCKGNGSKFFNKTCIDAPVLDAWNHNKNLFRVLFNNTEEVFPINQTIRNTLELNFTQSRTSPAEEFYRFYILDMDPRIDYGIHNLGPMNWHLFGCFILAWTLVFMCLWGGVSTSGKVVYFTALFPYVVLLILLIRGSILEGAKDGMWMYFKPRWADLLKVQIWRESAAQAFFSLGPALGSLITLASFNDFENNFVRDAVIVTTIDTLTSMFAGFMTFSFVGYVAHLIGKTPEDAVHGGPGLTFIVIPQALAYMEAGQLWSLLFFIMLLTLGLDSQFALFETVTFAVMDQFPKLQQHKSLVTLIGCIFYFVIGSATFCRKGSIALFTIYDDYSSGYVVLMLGLYQAVFVSWVYGLDRFMDDFKRMRGKNPNYFWRICWAVVTPIYLLILFIVTLVHYEPSESFGKVLPWGGQQLGWFLSSMPMMSILIFALYRIGEIFYRKLPWESLITPTSDWCPAADLGKSSRHLKGSKRLPLQDQPKKETRRPQEQHESPGSSRGTGSSSELSPLKTSDELSDHHSD